MPATLLCARFTDQELALRKQARPGVRPTLPNPAATVRALALAICEVEAGLRSASQLRADLPPQPVGGGRRPNYANNWRRLGFTDDDLVGQGSDRQ
jgi:hypothetical protein